MVRNSLVGLLTMVALGAGIWHIVNNKVFNLGAEEESAEKQAVFNDYGSITNPVSQLYQEEGRAAGQTIQAYGSDISMTTIGVGQNYTGRAFGL